MSNAAWQVTSLARRDIPALTALQPPDWGDVRLVFNRHLDHDYFHAFVIKRNDGLPVGVGEVIRFNLTAWLGNIIVHPEYQRQGLGGLLTLHGVKYAQHHGLSSIWLLATPQGAPVYERLGFNLHGRYLFYRTDLPLNPPEGVRCRRLKDIDHSQLFHLDQVATGEDRKPMLEVALQGALGTFSSDGRLTGFYLPQLGDGLIVANNQQDGMALLAQRQSNGKSYVVIPEANTWLCNYLAIRHFTVFRTAQLMALGPTKKVWHPEMVYSRIGGYAG